MIRELEFRITELERRLHNTIRICTVDSLDKDRVRVRDGSGLVTGPLHWVTRRAGHDRDWWAPEPGEQVVLLCPSGDPGLGVVLPGIYRDAFPAPADTPAIHRTLYRDGAMTEYDRNAHRWKAVIPGPVEITAAQVTIKGPLHVTGEIISDTSIEAPAITGSGSLSSPSILADGHEVARHDHECPHGGRTSELGD